MQITSSASSPGGRVSLARAFAISIAFHILLLWPAATVWHETVPSVPMVASLHSAAAPVAPAQPVRPPSLAQAAKRRNDNSAVAESLAIAAEQGETHAPDTSGSTASPATGSGPQAAPSAAEARPAAASALPAAAGLDADGLRAYRIALAGAARRYKRYPTRAIEAGWRGTTELRISVAAGQPVPAVQVIKSSGYPVLDEAALEMLRLALPATTVPATLRERSFAVELPIVFDLPQ